ncbi:hypothetical protein BsWGS_11487 [Bradybaena similaris]
MEFSLPLPHDLAKDGVLLRQWKQFSYRFQCHKNANVASEPLVKLTSLLLYTVSQEINTISEQLKVFDIDVPKLNKILEVVEQICLPRFIVLFERFRYFTLEHEATGSLTDFISILKKQGELCEFGEIMDSVLNSALVMNGVSKEGLQQSVNSGGICFDDAVNMFTSNSQSDKNASFSSTSAAVSKPRKSKKVKVSTLNQQDIEKNMFMVPLSDGMDDEGDSDNMVHTVMNVSEKKDIVKKSKTPKGATNLRPKLFLCFACDNEYATRKSFRRHIAAKHFDCKEYFCHHCNKTFGNRTECITHCKGHTSTPEAQTHNSKDTTNTEFLCWYCQETFANLQDYKKHNLTHSAVRVFSCDVCQKKNHTVIRMIGHIKGHLNPKHRCHICANCFGRPELLQAHLQTHAAKPLHHCLVCSKSFVSADRLQGHMRTHTGEKRFTCELCGKSFSQKMSFDYHKRWHAGEKPYECEICGRKARSFGDLRKHKRLHSDKLPYVCEVCGKSFRFTSNLNRHRRGHSGKRSYACDVCGRTFIYGEGLRDHIKAGRCPGRRSEGENKMTPRVRKPRAPTILNPHPHVTSDYSPINYTTTHHVPETMHHELPPWQYMIRGEPEEAGGLVLMPPYY